MRWRGHARALVEGGTPEEEEVLEDLEAPGVLMVEVLEAEEMVVMVLEVLEVMILVVSMMEKMMSLEETLSLPPWTSA